MKSIVARVLATTVGILAVSATAWAVAAPAQALGVGFDTPNGINQRVVVLLSADDVARVQQDWRESGAYCDGILRYATAFDWEAGPSSGLQRCADGLQLAALYASQAHVTGDMYAVYVNYPGPLGGWSVWKDSYTSISPW